MPKIHVSEHALLRYLERVKGLDLRAIEQEMLTQKATLAIELGAHAVPIGDGLEMIIKNRNVITVKPIKSAAERKSGEIKRSQQRYRGHDEARRVGGKEVYVSE